MKRSPSAALMPLAEAVRLLTADVRPVGARAMPLADALGCVVASDIIAPSDLPAEPIASQDGWAIAAADAAGASPFTPVLISDAPVWLEAGERLPDGADTVLPPEAVETKPTGIEVVMDAPTGAGVRGAGADALAGDVLVAAGTRIAPLHVLLLAAAGIAEIDMRVPRLGLIATGEARGRAQADALSPYLALACKDRGCVIAARANVEDSVAAIAAALGASDADAILVIGGTGFGHGDTAAAGLARAGKLEGHGLGLRPGETAGFGKAGGRPLLLLPGGIEAGVAVFLALGLPLIAALSGLAPATVHDAAPLLRKLTSTIGLDEIVFVRRVEGGVEALGGLDIPLRMLAGADGWLLVPADREGYAAGAMVEIRPL